MTEQRQATKRTLDFTNVREGSGINPKRKPTGLYAAEVVKVIENTSAKGNDQWVYSVRLVSDPTAVYPYYITLSESALWKLRDMLEAVGIKVPKKRVAVDPNKMVNRKLGVLLEDDEYDGKEKSVIGSLCSIDMVEENEPKAETPRGEKPTKATDINDDLDDDDADDDDEFDDEEIEL